MSELIERVARAMCGWGCRGPEDCHSWQSDGWAAVPEVLNALVRRARTTPLIRERIEQGSLVDGLELFAILEDLPWTPGP